MIAKTFEWYRIVSTIPAVQAVEARTKAATDLVASLSKQDPYTLFSLPQGIVREFDGSPSEAGATDWLLKTLKQHDPAISENLIENQLELRCIAAITLGEFLLRAKKKIGKQATVAAGAFVSAMNMRPLPRQRYLRKMIEELSGLALDVIELAADARRKRADPRQLQKEQLEITEITAAKQAISQLQEQILDLHRSAMTDGEEINLFWFIATGFSRAKRKAFSGLPARVAAVYAALDVHRFLLVPAPLNCFEVLAAIVERKRKAKELKPIPLNSHVAEWSSEECSAIANADSLDSKLASKFPAVFPLTWVANRIREGQSLPNWEEFNKITHLRGDASISPSQLSRQLLNEKIAVSLAGDVLE